jgi:hypothetical protein
MTFALIGCRADRRESVRVCVLFNTVYSLEVGDAVPQPSRQATTLAEKV